MAANIVLIPKKDRTVKMCVHFRDLNKAYSKNNFPLPYIDVIINSVTLSAMYFFMDGFFFYYD